MPEVTLASVISDTRALLGWMDEAVFYMPTEIRDDDDSITEYTASILAQYKKKLLSIGVEEIESFEIDSSERARIHALKPSGTAYDRRAPNLRKAIADTTAWYETQTAGTAMSEFQLKKKMEESYKTIGMGLLKAQAHDNYFLTYRSDCSKLGRDPPSTYEEWETADMSIRNQCIDELMTKPEGQKQLLDRIDKFCSSLIKTGSATAKECENLRWEIILTTKSETRNTYDASGYKLLKLKPHLARTFTSGFKRSDIAGSKPDNAGTEQTESAPSSYKAEEDG